MDIFNGVAYNNANGGKEVISEPTDSLTKIFLDDCVKHLWSGTTDNIALSFVDPPFRQGKVYRFFDDTLPHETYWNWMRDVLEGLLHVTIIGGAVYFMQREKNTEEVLRILRETGWNYQNLIVWKKKTSAVPCGFRYSKQYQIIVFATKGPKPRVFNKLRVDLPLAPQQKYARTNGVYLTDVWDDIRELTSGYFAGDEAIRETNGERAHTQQSPVALLLRIILSSSMPGDIVLDPFAGTGTTLVVAQQLLRKSVGVEIDPKNVELIRNRLTHTRLADSVLKYRRYYRYTSDLTSMWPVSDLLLERRILVHA